MASLWRIQGNLMTVRQRSSSAQGVAGHLASLDGLRGMAVLGVMASHLFPGNYGAGGWLTRTVGHIFLFGSKGVDLFFVLSGFLITGILFDSLSDTAYFRRFYARRALRIFPLYYGVILVLLVLTPWLGIVWHGVQWSLLFYMQNTSLATPIWDFKLPHGLDLIHFWSLAVEEQFYLVWPLAVFLIRDRRRLLGWCFAISCASLVLRFVLAFRGVPYLYINSGTLCRADSLLAGAALALLVRGPAKERVLAWGRWMLVGAAAVLVALSAAAGVLEQSARWAGVSSSTWLALNYTFFALGSAGLIAWCLRRDSVVAGVFENDALRWFGKYSYGIYVLHLVALRFFLDIFHGWFKHLTGNKPAIDLASGFTMFGLAVLMAYVSYNVYEQPFLRLKRYFHYDRPERIPVSEASAVDEDSAREVQRETPSSSYTG
jgi:peptidoglycan/LPS O-acetylase OafA/YrhL